MCTREQIVDVIDFKDGKVGEKVTLVSYGKPCGFSVWALDSFRVSLPIKLLPKPGPPEASEGCRVSTMFFEVLQRSSTRRSGKVQERKKKCKIL